MLDIRRIYAEPAALTLPLGQEVLQRFPDAEVVEVASHLRIPEVHGDERNVARWVRIKQQALVLGTLKSPRVRPNGRSADFIAPSLSNGCAMACAYCYVPRRKGYSNPITVFANTEQIHAAITRHLRRQGPKPEPNQCDPVDWVYDLGENSDCSVDALLSSAVAESIDLFGSLPGAKASFATKYVNRDLLALDPAGGTRVRFSLMPPELARTLDVRTSPVAERIAAIDDFVEAGYEVHVNFSPVVLTPTWEEDWAELLVQLGDGVGERARAQLACEVIMLTHNEGLHEVNLGWHPGAEELLWTPAVQQPKISQSGQRNVRYRTGVKGPAVARLRELIERHAPYLRVRYAF
jgi:spore photoproduct lyase